MIGLTIFAIIFCFLAIAIGISIIRAVFRINDIVLSLETNSENTYAQFKLIKTIKKQNDYSIEQSKILIDRQTRMLELLEQGIELLRENTEN